MSSTNIIINVNKAMIYGILERSYIMFPNNEFIKDYSSNTDICNREKVMEITKLIVIRAKSMKLVMISAILRNYNNILLIMSLSFGNEIKIQEEIKLVKPSKHQIN